MDRAPFLYVLVAAQSIVAFPPVYQKLKAPSCWSIQEIPVRAALRLEPEETFLCRRLPSYDMVRVIERTVPESERVLCLYPIAESYTAKRVLIYYESAESELEYSDVLTPFYSYIKPDYIWLFSFAATPVKAIRIAPTVSGGDIWSMNEISLFRNGLQVPHSPAWAVHASPNLWDTSLGLDGNLATSWSTWRSVDPGMFFEIDFGRPQSLDTVQVRWAPGVQTHITLALDLIRDNGRKERVGPPTLLAAPAPDLRRSAADAIRRRGTRYLMIPDSNGLAGDFLAHGKEWNAVMLGHWSDSRLYRLD